MIAPGTDSHKSPTRVQSRRFAIPAGHDAVEDGSPILFVVDDMADSCAIES